MSEVVDGHIKSLIREARICQVKPCILFFFLFLMEANYFTILWWVLPYIDMSHPQVYMCPPP